MDIHASETALLNRCSIVENTTKNLCAKYAGRVDEHLQTELNRLANRAREYEHGTFLILVVGPAKSGKSTLVNLIARDFVSPTGFLECTVRPSVISRRADGEESSLTVYSGTDSDMRLEQIDSIIDIIRGFGSEDDLRGVLSERMPLTEENIRRHVQLGLEKSLDSENLLSSIRTAGGNLLQDRVFVIDMPGFDGAYQNIDNPVYETIARRADLIIFVQSSNAAFSKVSKEFLNVLAVNNRSVPVCLVHNVFDAAWWRDPQSKKRDIETQRIFACNEIRRLGFNIDPEHSFCINLGAVDDSRHGMTDRDGLLAASAAEFDNMERLMYERIISKRDSMRLNNTLARVAQQRDHIINSVKARLAELNSQLERYDAEKRRLEKLRPTDSFTVPLPDLNVARMLEIAERECITAAAGINRDIKKNDSEARDILIGLLNSITTALNHSKDTIFGLKAVENNLYLEYQRAVSALEVELAALPGGHRADIAGCRHIDNIGDFDVAQHINIDNIVPRINFLKRVFNGRHTGENIHTYIGLVRQQLAPMPEEGIANDGGVLVRTDADIIQAGIVRELKALAEYYRSSLLDYYNSVSASILKAVLPRPEEARGHVATLTELADDLKKLTV